MSLMHGANMKYILVAPVEARRRSEEQLVHTRITYAYENFSDKQLRFIWFSKIKFPPRFSTDS